MSFREKLLDLKKRLSDRKMYSIVIVVIAAVAIWGIFQYKNASQLRQQLDNQYNRAFFDMNGYVQNVQSLLLKSMLTSTPSKTASMLEEAWRQSNLAQTNLGQLPVNPELLANTSKFLTQVGDLAYAYNSQSLRGKPLSNDQYKTLEGLYNYSVNLSSSLNNLQNQLSAGRLKWGKLANQGTATFKKNSTNQSIQQFENVDKTFKDIPKLIYDGPYSDHLVTMEPRGVTGETLNSEQAKENIKKIFGADKIDKITDLAKNDTSPIKTYTYTVSFKGAPKDQTATVELTQKGGHLFLMLHNRPVTASKLDINQAKEKAKAFLDSTGYKNMVDTYYLKQDNTATINYAYKLDNIKVYSDLIKVKVALDTGEIVGVEAKTYLSAHTDRKVPTAQISAKEARSLINSRVKIESTNLAIIPTEFKTEIFTYELKGKMNDKDFLIYINAKNGNEENVLMLQNTPNGTLTM